MMTEIESVGLRLVDKMTQTALDVQESYDRNEHMTNLRAFGELVACVNIAKMHEFDTDIRLRWTTETKVDGNVYYKLTELTIDGTDVIEPEVDWNEVEIDTPIFVRGAENPEWIPRHFAGYKESTGEVWAFQNGYTSHTTKRPPTLWEHAKLAKKE